MLKVSVTAAPEKGKANKALIRLLSREWKLPKSTITIVSGQKGRQKTLEITAQASDIEAAISTGLPGSV